MKRRVDELLVEEKYFKTKDEAMRAIMAGIVYNLKTQERIETAGMQVKNNDIIFEIKGKKHPYVSRGGLKLERAIDYYHIDFSGKIVLDIGSSTGGFTDCALQNGAKHVYALDVGTNQLAWKMRSDERVTALEQLNFKDATLDHFSKGMPDIIVTDVSFISLKTIFTHIHRLFADVQLKVVALIKPQFEAKSTDVGAGGIVQDEQVRQASITKIIESAKSFQWEVEDVIPSPITGTKGNIEYLLYAETKSNL